MNQNVLIYSCPECEKQDGFKKITIDSTINIYSTINERNNHIKIAHPNYNIREKEIYDCGYCMKNFNNRKSQLLQQCIYL